MDEFHYGRRVKVSKKYMVVRRNNEFPGPRPYVKCAYLNVASCIKLGLNCLNVLTSIP